MTNLDYIFSAIFTFLTVIAIYCVWLQRKNKEMFWNEIRVWGCILFVVLVLYRYLAN